MIDVIIMNTTPKFVTYETFGTIVQWYIDVFIVEKSAFDQCCLNSLCNLGLWRLVPSTKNTTIFKEIIGFNAWTSVNTSQPIRFIS